MGTSWGNGAPKSRAWSFALLLKDNAHPHKHWDLGVLGNEMGNAVGNSQNQEIEEKRSRELPLTMLAVGSRSVITARVTREGRAVDGEEGAGDVGSRRAVGQADLVAPAPAAS